jgi:hypothetical protein
MKTPEDEAFDELAQRQGAWGGGFKAKRQAAMDKLQDGKCEYCVDGCAACDARAQPAQEREWVGLTDEEIDEAIKACNTTDTYKYFRAIEAKLKEKNSA